VVYHGTPTKNVAEITKSGLKESTTGTMGRGYYFGFNEANAKSFVTKRASNSVADATALKFKIKPEAKILQVESNSTDVLAKKIDDLTNKLRESGNLRYPDKTNDAVRKLATDAGYDGIEIGGQTVIYNKNVISKPKTPLQEGGMGDIKMITRKVSGIPNEAPIARSNVIMSAEKNPFLSQDIKQVLTDKGFYNVRNTKDLIIKSRNLTQDFPQIAERIFHSQNDDVAIAIGEELIKKFSNAGDSQKAVQLIEELTKKGTGLGRGVQIFSAFSKLSPQDVGHFAQRQIDIANHLNPKLNLKMTETQYNAFYNAAKELQKLPEGYDKRFKTAMLVRDVMELIPSSTLKKIDTLQTMAQLLNPKTIIRNLGGNTGFGVLENVSQTVGAPTDKFISLFSGKRTVALPRPITQVKGLVGGLIKGGKEAVHGLNLGPQTQYDLPQVRVFKSKILNGLQRTMGLVLQAPDRAAYTAAFDDTVKGLMKANKLTEATPEILDLANYNALYRTFQDDSVVARVFMKLKSSLNIGKEFGAGSLIIKYPKTPGNIIARGFDYTPTGFINTLFQVGKPLFGKPFNQQKFVMSFSRALVGSTGLVGMGYSLHKLGIITGSPSKDKDVNAFQQSTGSGAYKINVSALKRFIMTGFNKDAAKLREGDTLISYDWAQPMAIPISLGAKLSEQNKGINLSNLGEYADIVASSIEQGVSTLQEQPLVTGIRRLFGSGGGIWEGLKSTAESAPASFIPTLMKQITQYFDNQVRETYDPNTLKESLNLAKAKIPFLAQTLPVRPDIFGKDKEIYQNGSNSIFNVFLNPAFVSKLEETPESKMVLDIYNQSGLTTQMPRVVNRSITLNGETRDLSTDEYIKLQKYTGDATHRLFSTLAQDPSFIALSPEEQAKELSNIMTDIGKSAKHDLFNEQNDAKSIDNLIIEQEKLAGFRGLEAIIKTGNVKDIYDLIDNMSKEDQDMFGRFKTDHEELKDIYPYRHYDNPTTQKAENTKVFKGRLMSDHPEEGIRFFQKLDEGERQRILDNMDNKGNEEWLKTYQEAIKENKSPITENTEMKKGVITVYNPDPNQTDETPHTGGLMRKMEFGDVALANRSDYDPIRIKYLNEGQDTFVKIPELESIKTPYGNGIFRVNDTMNERYKDTNNVDVFIPNEMRNSKEEQLIRNLDKTGASYEITNNQIASYSPAMQVQSNDKTVNKLLNEKRTEGGFKSYLYGDLKNQRIQESNIDREMRDYMYEQYPFTDEAKEFLDRKMTLNMAGAQNKAGGQYFESQKENANPDSYALENAKTEEEYNKILYNTKGGQSIDTQGNAENYWDPNVNTTAHESLHSFLMEHGRDKNLAWIYKFNSAWNKLKESNLDMQRYDEILQKDELYEKVRTNQSVIANERFAFFGTGRGQDGLEAFPQDMQQFYKDVFQKSTSITDLKTKQELLDEADSIVTRLDNGKITEEVADEMLNQIDEKLSKYNKGTTSFGKFLRSRGYK
jgi:hypothetical protein